MAATRATVIYKASFNADHVSIFALSMDTNQLFFLALLQLALYIYHVNTSTIKYYREVNATVNCNDLGQMDRAALAMTSYGDRSNSQPLTPEQVYEELCPKLNKSSRIIKAYAKTCFKPFPRQIIGLLVKGNLRELRKLCSSEEERYLFSKHSQCLQDFDPENVHKCMDNYIIDVESIRDNVHDLDLKLPYSCCIFWDFKQCIREEMGRGCSEEAVHYANDKITRASQESLDLTCKNYEEFSSNCLSLTPLQRNKQKTHISYLPALVDIFTNL